MNPPPVPISTMATPTQTRVSDNHGRPPSPGPRITIAISSGLRKEDEITKFIDDWVAEVEDEDEDEAEGDYDNLDAEHLQMVCIAARLTPPLFLIAQDETLVSQFGCSLGYALRMKKYAGYWCDALRRARARRSVEI